MAEAVNSGLTKPEVDEFEIMRRRVQEQGQRARERASEAAKRQFARVGNLPSGAAIKAESQALGQAEQATSQALQDVNIAQAQQQRQAHESQAQRELQKFGIQQQATTAREQLAGQREMQQAGLASQEKIAQLGETGATARQESQFAQQKAMQEIQGAQNIDMLSRTQEFQKAQSLLDKDFQERLQGQSLGAQKDLATMQMEFDKLALTQDWDKFTQTMDFQKLDAETRKGLSQAQMLLQTESQDLQKKMSEHAIAQDNSELEFNKMATVLNATDLLKANNFSDQEISNLLDSLGMGAFSQEMVGVMNGRVDLTNQILQTRQSNIAAAQRVSGTPSSGGFFGTPEGGR